jgi:ATP-binding cassette subfamily G (WHITE) protein 2 (PDR)
VVWTFLLAGITQKQMTTKFRGEAIYSAEQDVHFPQLTVGETLTFAAEARAVRHSCRFTPQKQACSLLKTLSSLATLQAA